MVPQKLFFISAFAFLLAQQHEGMSVKDTLVIGGIGPEGDCSKATYRASPSNCLTINIDPAAKADITGDAFDPNVYRTHLSKYAPSLSVRVMEKFGKLFLKESTMVWLTLKKPRVLHNFMPIVFRQEIVLHTCPSVRLFGVIK